MTPGCPALSPQPARRPRGLVSTGIALLLAACGGGDADAPSAPSAMTALAARHRLATATPLADSPTAHYDAATGQLWLPGVTVQDGSTSRCYDARLANVSNEPIRLDLSSASEIPCASAQASSGRFDTGTNQLSVPRLPVLGQPTLACYDVLLRNVGTTSLRLELQSAQPVTCTPPTPPAGSLSLTSPVAAEGGNLPADYTCDGTGATPALSWTGAPAGTKEYALLMTTLPGDGSTKWNWVLYGIPAGTTSLKKDSFGVGTAGVGSDGPIMGYQPPCSQGPGAKRYTFTVYALSGSPVLAVPAAQVTGAVLANAIAPLTLGAASLNLSYTRSTQTGSSSACTLVRNSTLGSSTGQASVSCDDRYAYVGSNGLALHTMMDGITATNLQVPTAQNFFGANAWKIPLAPAIAPTTVSAADGPIGVAINGVPIFNPCKQGGCQNGDTKVLGELDVCNGHAGRSDDYHYHAAPVCLMATKPTAYWDTHPLGWALDGFAIFGYRNADGSTATRDALCGGNTLPVPNAPAGYAYHVTDASPYVLSCFRGTPSPDLAGQAAKFSPMRQPPVTPFAVSGMTLSTDAADGYQVLRFSTTHAFNTTETGSDSYANAAGTYRIRYKPITGASLVAALALPRNAGKSLCWNFQFSSDAGKTTQPDVVYCR